MNKTIRLGAALGLLCNAFAWGVSWWPLRHLQAMGLHPLWATSIFFLVGTLVIGCWQPRAWGVLREHRLLWLLALASGMTNAAFNWAVSIGDVVRVVLLFYLMPVWAMLLARLWLGERVGRLGLLRTALALLGAALILQPDPAQPQHVNVLADSLGVFGGMSFALNNVLLRKEGQIMASARALAMFFGGTLVALALAAGLTLLGHVPGPPAPRFPWIALALGQALFLCAANLALQFGASRVPVNAASVIMLSEVVFAAGSSAWLAGEAMTWPKLVGGGLIVGGALFSALAEARKS